MLMAILSMGFVACDNYDMPNPPAQTNPQEPTFEAGSLNMSSLAGSTTIDLTTVNDANELVTLAEVTAVENLPEGYELSFVGQMAANDAFSPAVEFPTTVSGTQVLANPDDLDAAFHEALNTIDPSAKTVNLRYKAYAVRGTSSVRLGGADVYYCPMTASVKPFAPDFTVEEEYYIIGTCTNGAIDASKAIKMSNSGISPYDDPVFSVVVDITSDEAANGYNWAVVPRSTITAGKGTVLAPSDPELAGDFEGYLVNRDATEGIFGVINAENKHLITVNVRPDNDDLYHYSVQLAIPNLWTPGPANGWNQGASQLLYTNNYKNYEGYVHIDGEFKFTTAPDWAHTNLGFAGAGKLSTDSGAGNINVTENDEALGNGLYWCTADIVALTYTATAINTMGIIGDGTPGGWDSETVMTPSADFMTWTVKTTLKEGTFKFRANNDWAINLGGSLDYLSPGADNIPVPETGEVTITLDLSSIPYTATVVK